jgi:hypothetical protein
MLDQDAKYSTLVSRPLLQLVTLWEHKAAQALEYSNVLFDSQDFRRILRKCEVSFEFSLSSSWKSLKL